MKKLISIGVALALLVLVVGPVGVAAQVDCPTDETYDYPETYAKIPFAIIESGFVLLGNILPGVLAEFAPDLAWVADLMADIGGWAGGPLSWTVDMLAWGVSLVGSLACLVEPLLGDALPISLSGVFNTIACGLFTPFDCTIEGATFDPCGNLPECP